ncbi:MAG: ATP-binding cassette domain-containing protein [Actinomycetota bacterium]|nr:branched-chain amino acid ABC transporter ATP-binding protein/permease [Actinomycetota bacterium]
MKRLVGFALLVGGIILLPWLPGVPLSVVINADYAGELAIVAISLVILTGWVGQISLGQGAFVGIGAFTTGLLARGLHIPFPLNLPFAMATTAAVAALLGVVALRVRGLYLAVATLIFAWMADAYLFLSSWFVGKGGASTIRNRPIGRPGTVTHFDLSDKRVFYLVVVAVVAAVVFAARNLRDSKTGRAFFAVRGSETAAVSLGIDVAKYKLLAFAVSGALAGLAGNLLLTDLRTVTPVTFAFTQSLFFLSVAVVGGIMSLGGAVASGVFFAALNELFFRVELLNGYVDIVSVLLLLVVLLGYPGGLGALGPDLVHRLRVAKSRRTQRRHRAEVRRAEVRRAEERASAPAHIPEPGRVSRFARRLRLPSLRSVVVKLRPRRVDMPRYTIDPALLAGTKSHGPASNGERTMVVPPVVAAPAGWRVAAVDGFALPPDRGQREPVLRARNVIVRFGGLTAVNDVSLEVREHEIVGLIGPNGAGKTTTFNAIAGLNEPTAGTVDLFGVDVTREPVHRRAQMGVGRTFQLIQLFPQLSVFENLLVATHVHNETGFFSHVALTGAATRAERDARDQVTHVVSLLELEDVAHRKIAGLPFGILRQVEVARALVTRAPLLMLDEPASGLDNNETDELARLLYFLRAQLGISILLIEHDVRMVTSVCDYIYVINRGAPLADGTAAEIQRHPDVVSAYLGEPAGEMAREEPVHAGR